MSPVDQLSRPLPTPSDPFEVEEVRPSIFVNPVALTVALLAMVLLLWAIIWMPVGT